MLALTPKSFAVLAFLGVFQIGVAYVLFVRGLAYVTATQASLTGMLEPVASPSSTRITTLPVRSGGGLSPR